MIEAQELRLENWVYDSFKNRVVKVWGIDSNHDQITVNYANGSGVYTEDLKYIDPIELTEEWLLKFGFTRQPWGLVIGNLLFKDKNHECKELTLEVGNGFRTTVKYVHQLQNLYFALVGEELK